MIVVDVNVILSGLRSRNGGSFRLLRMMITGQVKFACSPAMLFEYEDVLKRTKLAFDFDEIDILLDAIATQCRPAWNWCLFRPFLDDPKDDLYVECALATGADVIVTFDRHFQHPAIKAFGLTALSPGDYLKTVSHGGDEQ